MADEAHLRKLYFRSWHRGTREADAIIGGFFDKYGSSWNEEENAWFERLLNEQDVDIMGWAMGTIEVPESFQGPMMDVMRKLDYISVPKGIEDMD